QLAVILAYFLFFFSPYGPNRRLPSSPTRRSSDLNDRRTWDAYSIRYWPSFVLIDKAGTIRYTGYGEFHLDDGDYQEWDRRITQLDRKSTRLNSSHGSISYAVFCLKKKKTKLSSTY